MKLNINRMIFFLHHNILTIPFLFKIDLITTLSTCYLRMLMRTNIINSKMCMLLSSETLQKISDCAGPSSASMMSDVSTEPPPGLKNEESSSTQR